MSSGDSARSGTLAKVAIGMRDMHESTGALPECNPGKFNADSGNSPVYRGESRKLCNAAIWLSHLEDSMRTGNFLATITGAAILFVATAANAIIVEESAPRAAAATISPTVPLPTAHATSRTATETIVLAQAH